MKLVKSLMLGSAAGIIAMSGAQAADLPVKAKAVEYVRICSLYGAGFYYIPGTDTCIKIGGYLRVDVGLNGGDFGNNINGRGGAENRLRDYYVSRSRTDLSIDTRTATEYGVLRTYAEVVNSWTTGDPTNSGTLGVYYVYIQFAGFTLGKAISQFSMPWTNYPANNFDGLVGGGGDVTASNQLTYTFQLGNGVSVALSAQDQSNYTQGQLWNLSAATATGVASGNWGTNDFAGNRAPDLIAMVRLDQAWGQFQASFAAHQNTAGFYSNTPGPFAGNGLPVAISAGVEPGGHPSDKWGWAAQLGTTVNLPMLGPGDTLNFSAVYTKGASRYDFQELGPQTLAMYGGSSFAYQSVGLAGVSDSVFVTGGGLQLTETYGFRGGYNHNWDPHWSSGFYGAMGWVHYNGTAVNAICFNAASLGGFVGSCNPNFNVSSIGMITRWTPVKNFTFSFDVAATHLDQNFSGTWRLPEQILIGKPAGATFEAKDQTAVSALARVQRNF